MPPKFQIANANCDHKAYLHHCWIFINQPTDSISSNFTTIPHLFLNPFINYDNVGHVFVTHESILTYQKRGTHGSFPVYLISNFTHFHFQISLYETWIRIILTIYPNVSERIVNVHTIDGRFINLIYILICIWLGVNLQHASLSVTWQSFTNHPY